jgi:hypothetical protein
MDLRRVERLIDLARTKGVTRLSITDSGVEMELGAQPTTLPGEPRPATVRRRVPRDPESVDAFIKRHLTGTGSSEAS